MKYIYIDCYVHQNVNLMYDASRAFPVRSLIAGDFAAAKAAAPRLSRWYDRIIITDSTEGVNPVPLEGNG